jgi:hypothetical protein
MKSSCVTYRPPFVMATFPHFGTIYFSLFYNLRNVVDDKNLDSLPLPDDDDFEDEDEKVNDEDEDEDEEDDDNDQDDDDEQSLDVRAMKRVGGTKSRIQRGAPSPHRRTLSTPLSMGSSSSFGSSSSQYNAYLEGKVSALLS